MKIIADSGSTKTDWAILKESKQPVFTQTRSLNPYFIDRELSVNSLLENKKLYSVKEDTLQIFFYSAGCGNGENKRVIREILFNVFPKSEINIETDLLGAARGLLKSLKGIIAILGTGSNSGYYDGKKISSKQPSLGYILGDEGSGNAIGKALIRAYAYNEMPKEMVQAFESAFEVDQQKLLGRLYKESFPAYYLASFASFCIKHKNEKFIHELIQKELSCFFKHHILRYENIRNCKIAFTGSVAWEFKNILDDLSGQENLYISKVEKAPIHSLADYHFI